MSKKQVTICDNCRDEIQKIKIQFHIKILDLSDNIQSGSMNNTLDMCSVKCFHECLDDKLSSYVFRDLLESK